MLRKLPLLIIIAILYSPFGLPVQAETDINGNKTVSDMYTETNDEATKARTDEQVDKPAGEAEQDQDLGVSTNEPPQFKSQFSWFDFVKMFLALGVVIALIYIILRFINKKSRLYGHMKTMENLGGITLGTNRSVQLIRIGDTVLVVGVGETIQLLKEITSPDEIAQLTNQNDVQSLQVGQTILNNMGLIKRNTSNQQKSSVNNFSSMLKGQLDDLAEGRKKVYDKFKRDQDE